MFIRFERDLLSDLLQSTRDTWKNWREVIAVGKRTKEWLRAHSRKQKQKLALLLRIMK